MPRLEMKPSARLVFYAIIVVVGIAAVAALASIFIAGEVRTVLHGIAIFGTATGMFLGLVFAFVGESRR